MELLTFLQKILPPAGNYISVILSKGQPAFQTAHTSIEDLAARIAAANRRSQNVYYGVVAYGNETKTNKQGREVLCRTQTNVVEAKALWIDVDCGEDKNFASQDDALEALSEFLAIVPLPTPMIVSSGRGLHVYWPFTEAIPVDAWQLLAECLTTAIRQAKFNVNDVGITGDSARILRPLGSLNPKNNCRTELLLDADPSDVSDIFAALEPYLPVQQEMQAAPSYLQGVGSTIASNLVSGIAPHAAPANADALQEKCPQIGWCVRNQEKVPEPLWYALLGVAAFCDDPEETAKRWSNKHPEYDEARTLEKLHQWQQKTTGPATCEKFKLERPTGCAQCKLAGRITTPCSIGRTFQAVTLTDPTVLDQSKSTLPLPYPYKLTTAGIKRTVDGTDIDICSFPLYPVAYGYDERLGYEVVLYHWYRQNVGWVPLTFRQAFLGASSGREFSTAIGDQGIVLRGAIQTQEFQRMLLSYMDALKAKQSTTTAYDSLGWKEDFKEFVLGDTVYCADGTTHTATLSKQIRSSVGQSFEERGSFAEWYSVTELVDALDLYVHQLCIGISLAAPLYAITGLMGATISLYGRTGGGKTLAQYMMQSIWGAPHELHFASRFTANGIYARLATLSNLPLTIDEATRIKPELIADFVYDVTQGRDKVRLTRDSQEQRARTWAAPVVMSTNAALMGKLIATGTATEAQMVRLLELEVPVIKEFQVDTALGATVYHTLEQNCGHVGPIMLRKYMQLGMDKIKADYEALVRRFPQEFGIRFKGSERYWEQVVVLALLALRYARQENLVAFDSAGAVKAILPRLAPARTTIDEALMTSVDYLCKFLSEHVPSTVTVLTTKGARDPIYIDNVSRGTQQQIVARVTLRRDSIADAVNDGDIAIDRHYFRDWVIQHGGDLNHILQDLDAEGILIPATKNPDGTTKRPRVCLGKDTPYRTPQVDVFRVSMLHDRLLGMLNQKDVPIAIPQRALTNIVLPAPGTTIQ